ncbi:OmpP1/FadL family transporter [Magnetospira sp. QH-2]|uniref:OmpP1/FadL family transporter n=1 Tax=Magnetospira sp. (strain QH-2) TaxID=1288970 RepID=UPI0003E8175C|nr:outer membrane protein transport protein [Magnetospira sp. QH-2]CCQ73280.1 Exported protein of unknown function [Magnetospira sp. QH-2]
MRALRHLIATTALIAASVGLSGQSAQATNGFLSHCVGVNNCGMGGAGIAMPQDATGAGVNPALMGNIPDQVIFSPGWFHPERYRDLSKTNSGFVNKDAKEWSQVEDFVEGSMGFNTKIDGVWSVGVSMYGSGGMHTKYDSPRLINTAGGGLFQAGDSEVRYRLAHLAPTVTYKPTERHTLGVSLILGYSDFMTNFANSAFQETPGWAGNPVDRAFGYGFRVGGLYEANKEWTLGLTASTPVWFQSFETYNDLLKGSINTPMTFGAGVVHHYSPKTDIAVDLKWLGYGLEETLADAPAGGGAGGAIGAVRGGFGWQSIPVFAVGVEHRLDMGLKLRAGYNYSPTPIPDDVVFANAMFPAVVEHHLSVGSSMNFGDNWELGGSFFYALENEITDTGNGDSFSFLGGGTSIGMWQMGAQVGITYKF